MSHVLPLLLQLQSITAWLVLICRPAESRRLSWPGWLVTYKGGFSAPRGWPNPIL